MGYKVISLFSGCGGLDLGFEGGFEFLGKEYPDTELDHVFANDIWERAVETYNFNYDRGFFSEKAIEGDIKEILSESPEKIPDGDVVTGGFPCKDFSIAGKRQGLEVERGRLYKHMKEVIELRTPKVFVAENVNGLANMGDVLSVIESDFKNINPPYEVKTHFLNAANYGVPQKRKRLFIVGVRSDLDSNFLTPLPSTEGNPITAQEALKDLEFTPDENNEKDHPPNHDEISGAKNYGEHLQGNKPIAADKPSPTIRSEHHGNIEFHYKLDRRLSVREAARLQSFPDDFVFAGSMSSNYKVLGNAVPPVLGWHIACEVYSTLEGKNKEKSRSVDKRTKFQKQKRIVEFEKEGF